WCAATALAEIRQCWTPESKNLRSIAQQLRGLADLRYHDIIALAHAPLQIGTAPHFAATSCPYSSVPFAEMTTGVAGLLVGREIFCEDGRLALQLNEMHQLAPGDVRRIHVIDTVGDLSAKVRTLLACQVAPGAYELYPLKDYTGSPPIAPRAYSHDELQALADSVYLAHRHLR
ncbi:MAG TPA: hypothetical protein VEU62_20915, partial [Bryobacterales bacterium]|nr:hypothetical protein [Bryobacterales bacterium]